MEIQGKNTFTSVAQSFVLALIALIAGVNLYLTVVVDGLVKPDVINGSLGLFIYGMVNAICCFFIVRYCPMSIWFVPLILNAFVIVLVLKEPDLLKSSMWLPICGGSILSIIASFAGAKIGDKDHFVPIS